MFGIFAMSAVARVRVGSGSEEGPKASIREDKA
jgi:hypothetical protein